LDHEFGPAYWSSSINPTPPPVGIPSSPKALTKPNSLWVFFFKKKEKHFLEKIMATLKLHGTPISTNTQRVLATLYEKEVEFELVNVNLGAGEHKQEPHISLNVSALLILKDKSIYLFPITNDHCIYRFLNLI
jgi:hypothetical protein